MKVIACGVQVKEIKRILAHVGAFQPTCPWRAPPGAVSAQPALEALSRTRKRVLAWRVGARRPVCFKLAREDGVLYQISPGVAVINERRKA